MKNCFLILLFIPVIFVSCNREKKNDIELIVENKEILISDTNPPDVFSNGYERKYEISNGYILKYKLRNNSDDKFFIFFDTEKFDCNPRYRNKSYTMNLSFCNQDDSLFEMKPFRMSARRALEKCDCQIDYDSIAENKNIELYRKIGYRNTNYFVSKNSQIVKHGFSIGAHETLFFRTFTTLPFQIDMDNYIQGFNDFKKGNKYYVRLYFGSMGSEIMKNMTPEQIKNIHANSDKFLTGVTYSNKVPVRFLTK